MARTVVRNHWLALAALFLVVGLLAIGGILIRDGEPSGATSPTDHTDPKESSRPSIDPGGRLGVLEAGRSLAVVVSDSISRQPLEGARVVLRDESGAAVFEAVTHRDGKVLAEVSFRDGTVNASLAGYSPAVAVPIGFAVFEVQVELTAIPPSISGLVRDPEGAGVAGILVCAWPTGSAGMLPDLYGAIWAEKPVTGLLDVYTENDGSFALELPGPLASQTRWALCAGGSGYVTAGSTVFEFAPGGRVEDLVLPVVPVYGCELGFVDSKGGELEVSRNLVGSEHRAIELEGVAVADLDWPSLGILGLSREVLRKPHRRDAVHLYVREAPPVWEELWPMVLDAHVPGYHEVTDVHIALPRVYGAPERVEVALMQEATSWCDVSARIMYPWSVEQSTSGFPELTIKLTNRSTREAFGCAILTLSSGTVQIGRLPAGVYDISWITAGRVYDCGSDSRCAEGVDLTGDSGAFDVGLSHLGRLRINALLSDGDQYEGMLAGRLEKKMDGTSVYFGCSWSGAPYFCSGIPAGDYVLGLRYPPEMRGRTVGVRVEAGKETACTSSP